MSKRPLLVTGHIASGIGGLSNGRAAIAAGQQDNAVSAAVTRLIWYPGLASAKVGDVITPVTLTSATTDAGGNYTLSASPDAAMLKEAASNGGWMNFDITVSTPAGEQTVEKIARAWDGASWSGRSYADKSPQHSVVTQIVHSSNNKILNGSVTKSPALVSQSATLNGSVTKSPALIAPAVAIGCQYVITSTTRNSVRVLNFHSVANAHGTWSYGSTADSSIDAAFKPVFGSWYASGSAHIGNTNSGKIGGATDGQYDAWTRTDFRFTTGVIRDYFGSPSGTLCSGAGIAVGDQSTNPTSWAGGIADDKGAGSGYVSCSYYPQSSFYGAYPRGTFFTKSSSTATRIGWVVGLGFVNLGGSSGYSSNVSMHWDANRGNGIYLCGTTGDETATPGVIYAQNR